MIERVLRLKNLGLLAEAVPGKAVEFGRHTVIYGDNGSGKSMLAHLLRSLATGKCDPLRPRQTIGRGQAPEAEFVIERSHYCLKGYEWQPPQCPAIEIFDDDFVSSNVYSGSAVDIDHRRNLCRFILGQPGVQLAERVQELAEEIKEIGSSITSMESRVEASLDGVMTVDEYLGSAEVVDLGAMISEAEGRVKAEEHADEIADHPELQPIRVSLPTSSDLTALGESIEAVAAEASRMVAEHITEHLGPGGEEWLSEGIQHAGEVCPFCAQSIRGLKLIEAMRGYFSESYRNLKSRIEAGRAKVEEEFGERGLRSIQSCVGGNETAFEFWRAHVSIDQMHSPMEEIETGWQGVRQLLLDMYDRKLAEPTVALGIPETVSSLRDLSAAAVAAATTYNEKVEAVNEEIRQRKSAAEGEGDGNARRGLSRLRLQERRWSQEGRSECDSLLDLRKKRKELEAEKEQARKKLEEHLSAFTQQYESELNAFLEKCGTSFKLKKLEAKFPSGKPASDFCICVLGYEAKATAGPTDSPHFGTMMSDGDKRILAFALFLARMKKDEDLARKIVVLDDPVSSLGLNRSLTTMQAVVDLAQDCAQLIVLTHDADFAVLCHDALALASTEEGRSVESLRLKGADDWSVLEPCDLDGLYRTAYEHNIGTIEGFLSGTGTAHAHDVVKCFRPVIETLLRFKYPGAFKGTRTLGDMIARIEGAREGGQLAHLEGHVAELREVNDYSWRPLHGNRHTDRVGGQEHEVRTFARRVLKLRNAI